MGNKSVSVLRVERSWEVLGPSKTLPSHSFYILGFHIKFHLEKGIYNPKKGIQH